MPQPNPYGWKNLKNTGKGPPAGPPPAQPAHRPGSPPAGAAPPGKRSRRWRTLALAGLFVGVLSALIVWVISLLGQSKYPAVVIVAFQAPKSLAVPDNTSGLTTATAIQDWSRDGEKRAKKVTVVSDPTTRDGWKKDLKPTAGGLVLYFSAAVGAEEKKPFVWLPPTPPAVGLHDGDKLHLDTILAELKPHSGPKLLVFDVAPPTGIWARGEAFNDFAQALKDSADKIKDVPGLVVLCSVDTDQPAWAMDDLPTTVFGHQFVQGLRGAGGTPNQPVTVAEMYTKHLKDAVNGWAVKFRRVSQTPILLPEGEPGLKLAEAVVLGMVPPGGYQPPAKAAWQKPDLKELQEEWKRTEKLAQQRPEQLTPSAWRQYLDWLLRWEESARAGRPVTDARDKVRDLGTELSKAVAAADPFVTLAVPTKPVAPDDLTFGKLWALRKEDTRAAWVQHTKSTPDNVGFRRWAAEQVLEHIAKRGGTAADFERADQILKDVDSALPERPVETHLLRLFAAKEHLNPTQRENTELWAAIRSCLSLRALAEQAAWGGTAAAAHRGQVYRWTRSQIPSPDRARQRGEDLLFEGSPASRQEAKTLFDSARTGYDGAMKHARLLATALTTRDRVFAHLPYYARWVNQSGTQKIDAARLAKQLELAAEKAHAINAQLLTVPAKGADIAPALNQLAEDGLAAQTAFEEVEQAYRAEVSRLKEVQAQPDDWHALDAAVRVPLLPADERGFLFAKLLTATEALATAADDRTGIVVEAPKQKALASHQLRMARAYLGEPRIQIPLDESAPRDDFRRSSDEVGRRFRGFPEEVEKRSGEAVASQPLIDKQRYRQTEYAEPTRAETGLTEAARLTRLADPVAAVTTAPDPVEAEHRYWRHEFLLWQAERCIRDGWADISPSDDTGKWYCRNAAKSLILEAEKAVVGLIATPTAAQRTQLSAACEDAKTREPVVVQPVANPSELIVQDRKQWGFRFSLRGTATPPTGYPTYWLTLPESYKVVTEKQPLRGVDRSFADGAPPPRSEQFPNLTLRKDEPPELVTRVLYRGHLAARTTRLEYTGPPTIELINKPSQDKPRMALQADDRVITGALTVLIDRSGSMMKEVEKGVEKVTNRTPEAVKGLVKLLKHEALPEDTFVTLAGFYGVPKQFPWAKPLSGRPKKIGSDRLNPLTHFGVTGDSFLPAQNDADTPLAWSIAHVLSKNEYKNFWPEPGTFTGVRTLVVLTDGADSRSEAPASDIMKALLATDDPVQLILVFFDMDAQVKKDAAKQFQELVRREGELRDKGKLPVILIDEDVKNGDDFARKVIDSFRPLIRYAAKNDPTGKDKGVLIATMGNAKQGEYAPTAPLIGREYELSGAPKRVVQLDDGDQLVLNARARGVFVLPTVFNYAASHRELFPHAEAGVGRKLWATIPFVKLNFNGSTDDALLKLTLERDADPKDGTLRLSRPLFPWFDVTDPAANAADGLPRMTVTNDPALVAPAWDLRLHGWERARAPNKATRTPTVTAHWIDADTLNGLASKSFPVDTDDGYKLSELTEQPVEPTKRVWVHMDRGPDGAFLNVEVDYEARGQLPYLRTSWGGSKPPERHAYYDPQHRYTARYGPLSPTQLGSSVRLNLYSVADLREKARGGSQAVTVNFPKEFGLQNDYDRSKNLKFAIPK